MCVCVRALAFQSRLPGVVYVAAAVGLDDLFGFNTERREPAVRAERQARVDQDDLVRDDRLPALVGRACVVHDGRVSEKPAAPPRLVAVQLFLAEPFPKDTMLQPRRLR